MPTDIISSGSQAAADLSDCCPVAEGRGKIRKMRSLSLANLAKGPQKRNH